MNISHPEQLLKKIEDDFNLLILREGSVGFTAKRRNCGFNDCVIDSVKVKNNDKPFVLGLEFLTRFRPIYETKSLEYSVVYSLNYDELIGILRDSHMDYLHFCVMRDKNRSIPDEF